VKIKKPNDKSYAASIDGIAIIFRLLLQIQNPFIIIPDKDR